MVREKGYLDTDTGMVTFHMPDPEYDLERRAIRALALINVEFATDPMSVQCFDLKLVSEVRDIIETRKKLEATGTLPPVLGGG